MTTKQITRQKQCYTCKEIKPLDGFNVDRSYGDDLSIHCRQCVHVINKRNYIPRPLPHVPIIDRFNAKIMKDNVSAEFKRNLLRKISREVYHLEAEDFNKTIVALQHLYADRIAYKEDSEDLIERSFFPDESMV